MQSTEAHMKEKQRREKIEIIFSHRIKGESYFHGSSYQWKNIVYQNYNRIQQKELEVEQLISKMEKIRDSFYAAPFTHTLSHH